MARAEGLGTGVIWISSDILFRILNVFGEFDVGLNPHEAQLDVFGYQPSKAEIRERPKAGKDDCESVHISRGV